MQNQYPQQGYQQPMNQAPQNDKMYVGGAKAINTQYGELLKISFNAQDLQLMQSMLNEKGWVNLNCNRRQQPSQYGQTHSIVIDTWQPQQMQQPPQPQYQQPVQDNTYTQQPGPPVSQAPQQGYQQPPQQQSY
jgi:hypothetical protein